MKPFAVPSLNQFNLRISKVPVSICYTVQLTEVAQETGYTYKLGGDWIYLQIRGGLSRQGENFVCLAGHLWLQQLSLLIPGNLGANSVCRITP